MKRLFRGKWHGIPIALITCLLAGLLIVGIAFALHEFSFRRIGPVEMPEFQIGPEEWPEFQIHPDHSLNLSGNFTWQWVLILDEDTS